MKTIAMSDFAGGGQDSSKLLPLIKENLKAFLNTNVFLGLKNVKKNEITPLRKGRGLERKTAFTLAEVLITLGIIGIVAAMTLPTLIQNHRKQVVETRLAKFNSVINQAIRRSEVDNGAVKYWDKLVQKPVFVDGVDVAEYDSKDTIQWFEKYLKPYLNTLRIEEAGTSEGNIQVYFNDGSMVLISPNSWIFYPEAKNYIEVEDLNNKKVRKKEDSGAKWFTFIYQPDFGNGGVYPYLQSRNPTDDYIRSNTSVGCTKQMPSNERALCTLMIARNGWKIPKDYPLKF